MVRRALTRQTRWYQNRCSIPLKYKWLLFGSISMENFRILTPGEDINFDLSQKGDRNYVEMIFQTRLINHVWEPKSVLAEQSRDRSKAHHMDTPPVR